VYAPKRALRCDPDALRVVSREVLARADQEKMIEKHEDLIAAAAKRKVQILGLQELFYGPYFCAEQDVRWYELTERVPDGPL